MDLHVYRNSQDRWYDLRSAARDRGAVLAVNAVTLDELAERLTPDVKTATPGQRLALLSGIGTAPPLSFPNFLRYAYDAIADLKAARIKPSDLRAAGVSLLGDILEQYDKALREACLHDPHDRRALAASRVRETTIAWLQRFQRVVLHALYDLTEAEFLLVRSVIEALPDGGTVIVFNTTANVRPTQFAEWTWQRFVQEESLAEKTFPEFCRSSRPSRAVLERLFVFGPEDPLPPDDSLRIVRASGRYNEIQAIGGEIADLLIRGETPNEIAVVVRHIDIYGEMIEDVFTRYGIPHSFETGIPLLRIPFIKYWLSLLDLVTSERSRDALARVMSSAYFTPRISPGLDVERTLADLGYIDRFHLRASSLAARKNSRLTPELERFEQFLDSLERANDTTKGFLAHLQPSVSITERDRRAWRVLVEELGGIDLGVSGFAEFRRLVSEIAGLRTADRSSSMPPAPGVPRVRIASPNSLGYREYKWIFAPGFADGEFPARSASNPLLPDETVEAINARVRSRRIMTSRDRNRKEPLYLFMILDSALNRVTITYPGSTLEGNTIYPSVYIREILRHYTDPAVGAVTPSANPIHSHLHRAPLQPRSEGEWLSAVATEWRRGMIADERARQLLGSDIVERVRIESNGKTRADIRRNVLPAGRVWHPSELNSLSACPFVFLARHVLRVRASEVPDFEVPAMEIGILVHAILRDFYTESVPASTELASSRMNEIIERRLAAADVNGQGPYSVFDPSLWKIRRRQVVSVLNEYVNFALRDALDGFETQLDYLDAALPAAKLGEVLLSGRPDHVAVHRNSGRIDAIRIDDFKYSAASSSTAKLLKDSFQIPIYAYLAAGALAAEEHVRLEGRYLLLRSPGNPVVSYNIDGAVFAEVRERIEKLLVKVRNGVFHPEPADKQNCTDCEYRRLCRLYGG
jgi:CRISPR/Cas system-associated exonuclease Cas4 (RecB family)